MSYLLVLVVLCSILAVFCENNDQINLLPVEANDDIISALKPKIKPVVPVDIGFNKDVNPISLDDRVIQPVDEIAYLRFGHSMRSHGNIALIGTETLFGSQVHVYCRAEISPRSQKEWSLIARYGETASTSITGFGSAFDVHAGHILIGAKYSSGGVVYALPILSPLPNCLTPPKWNSSLINSQILRPPAHITNSKDLFGSSISIGDDFVAIGAPGINKVFIFAFDKLNKRWNYKSEIVSSQSNPTEFGAVVSFSKYYLAVAAPDESDETFIGSVYVYNVSIETGAALEFAKVHPLTNSQHCAFGYNVRLMVSNDHFGENKTCIVGQLMVTCGGRIDSSSQSFVQVTSWWKQGTDCLQDNAIITGKKIGISTHSTKSQTAIRTESMADWLQLPHFGESLCIIPSTSISAGAVEFSILAIGSPYQTRSNSEEVLQSLKGTMYLYVAAKNKIVYLDTVSALKGTEYDGFGQAIEIIQVPGAMSNPNASIPFSTSLLVSAEFGMNHRHVPTGLVYEDNDLLQLLNDKIANIILNPNFDPDTNQNESKPSPLSGHGAVLAMTITLMPAVLLSMFVTYRAIRLQKRKKREPENQLGKQQPFSMMLSSHEDAELLSPTAISSKGDMSTMDKMKSTLQGLGRIKLFSTFQHTRLEQADPHQRDNITEEHTSV